MKKSLLISFACFLFLYASFAMAQQDFSKVEIKANHVSGNIYLLEGSGGNIGASVGSDGILIVDDQFAPLANKIQAALKDIGGGKLKFILFFLAILYPHWVVFNTKYLYVDGCRI